MRGISGRWSRASWTVPTRLREGEAPAKELTAGQDRGDGMRDKKERAFGFTGLFWEKMPFGLAWLF